MPDDLEPTGGETPPEKPSKSSRKREMQVMRDLGERLLSIPDEQLSRLPDTDLVEAVNACKKITKGNARKRQLQYISKLLRNANVDEVQRLVDRYDARSRTHVLQFHQLERWRENLIAEEPAAMDEILATYPQVDRQHLRQLVRNAITERNAERQPPVQYRKLFQYLKSLVD